MEIALKLAANDPFNKRQIRLYEAGKKPKPKANKLLQKTINKFNKSKGFSKSPRQKKSERMDDAENNEDKKRVSRNCSDIEEIIPPSEDENPFA